VIDDANLGIPEAGVLVSVADNYSGVLGQDESVGIFQENADLRDVLVAHVVGEAHGQLLHTSRVGIAIESNQQRDGAHVGMVPLPGFTAGKRMVYLRHVMAEAAKVASAWKYFDHFFCVNLDRRPDRWAEAQAELLRCGVPACERLSAVDRRGMPGGGAAGCGASHRVIWRRIAAGTCGERVVVFEDDFMLMTREVLLRAGYAPKRKEVEIYDSLPGQTVGERLAAILPYVPASWDLLYLGGGYQAPPISRLNEHLIRNGGMLTTHAYAITRKMAKMVTEYLDAGYGVGTEDDPTVHSGAPDSLLADLSKRVDIVSYTITPRLFIQRPTSQSDLDPKPAGFPWDQTDSSHELMV
jgi:hypothetical protein